MSLAPVTYVSTFRSKDLEKTKFIQVLDDHTEKHEVNTYTGREGLEAVVHCNNRFQRVALKMDWTPQEKFEKYENILNDGALQYWTTTVIPTVWSLPTTGEMFSHATQMMINHFSGSDKARDFIVEYVQSRECRKTPKTSVNDHVNRIQHLLDIANMCEGEEDYLSESRVKRILFNTFPNAWRTNFTNSGKIITDLTLTQIQQYFNLQKKLSDDNTVTYNNRNPKRTLFNRNNQGRRWTNNKRQNRGNNQRQDISNQQHPNPSTCRHVEHKHLSHKHLWKDCVYNPRSKNYRGYPYSGQGSRNQYNSGRTSSDTNNKASNQSNPRKGGNYQNHFNKNETHVNEEINLSSNDDAAHKTELHAFNSIGNEDNKPVANVGWRLGTDSHDLIE